MRARIDVAAGRERIYLLQSLPEEIVTMMNGYLRYQQVRMNHTHKWLKAKMVHTANFSGPDCSETAKPPEILKLGLICSYFGCVVCALPPPCGFHRISNDIRSISFQVQRRN